MKFQRIRIFVFLLLFSILAKAEALLDVPIGIAPTMSSAAMYIAVEKGYFKEQGINPLINSFKSSGAAEVPLLATGQLFVGGGNVSAGMYNAIASDIPIKVVADKGIVTPKHGYLALIVRKDHVESGRYKTFKDLKGMTMAVTAKGVSQEIATERYLQSVGLSLSDINLKHLAYADINIALANKSLDASIQIEPFVAAAVKNDIAVRVAGNDEVYPNQQSAIIMYSPVFIEKHPQHAKGFMIAYVKAMRDYNDAFEKNKGKEEIIQMLLKHIKVKDPNVFDEVVPVGLHPDGMLDVASLKADAQWYFEKGYAKASPNIDNIVDLSYVQHAVKVLGAYQ